MALFDVGNLEIKCPYCGKITILNVSVSNGSEIIICTGINSGGCERLFAYQWNFELKSVVAVSKIEWDTNNIAAEKK